jgi:hypothetical protein
MPDKHYGACHGQLPGIGRFEAFQQRIRLFLYCIGLYFKGILFLFKHCPPLVPFVSAQGFLRIDQGLKLSLKCRDLSLLGFGRIP